MANHRFQGNCYTLEKFPVVLWAYASSADYSVTQTAGTDIKTANRSLGISSVVETATGVFKISLKQKYHSILSAGVMCQVAESEAAYWDITAEDVDGATPYITLSVFDHAGAALDLPDTTILNIRLEFRNSGLG